jgi:hypothetical protein
MTLPPINEAAADPEKRVSGMDPKRSPMVPVGGRGSAT